MDLIGRRDYVPNCVRLCALIDVWWFGECISIALHLVSVWSLIAHSHVAVWTIVAHRASQVTARAMNKHLKGRCVAY